MHNEREKKKCPVISFKRHTSDVWIDIFYTFSHAIQYLFSWKNTVYVSLFILHLSNTFTKKINLLLNKKFII